jgi:hypothetical protein
MHWNFSFVCCELRRMGSKDEMNGITPGAD